ncbi:hypothetical protein [Trichormus azollae]|nr:hypothetical protein [Trichormus azollae]
MAGLNPPLIDSDRRLSPSYWAGTCNRVKMSPLFQILEYSLLYFYSIGEVYTVAIWRVSFTAYQLQLRVKFSRNKTSNPDYTIELILQEV